MSHNFHFKLEISLIEKLNKINKLSKFSFSAKINFIIKVIYVFLEKKHYDMDEKLSQYKRIARNRNTHVNLNEDDYQRLKHLHKDLNYYSIAQILRNIIERFIFYYQKYGFEKLMLKINQLNKSIKEKFTRRIYRKKIRQLYHFNYYSVVYDSGFTAVEIKLLK